MFDPRLGDLLQGQKASARARSRLIRFSQVMELTPRFEPERQPVQSIDCNDCEKPEQQGSGWHHMVLDAASGVTPRMGQHEPAESLKSYLKCTNRIVKLMLFICNLLTFITEICAA